MVIVFHVLEVLCVCICCFNLLNLFQVVGDHKLEKLDCPDYQKPRYGLGLNQLLVEKNLFPQSNQNQKGECSGLVGLPLIHLSLGSEIHHCDCVLLL